MRPSSLVLSLALVVGAAMGTAPGIATAQETGQAVLAPAPRTGTPDEGYERRLALTRRLLQAQRAQELLVAGTRDLIDPTIAPEPGDTAEEARTKAYFAQLIADSAATIWPVMFERSAQMHAEVMTEEELLAQLALYESEIGASITAKTLLLAERNGELMKEVVPLFQAEMVRRLCLDIDCEGKGVHPNELLAAIRPAPSQEEPPRRRGAR